VTQTDRGVYVAAIRAAAGSSTLWGAIAAALLDTSVAAVNRTMKELMPRRSSRWWAVWRR
jgi:hypothetical protein